MVFPSRGDRLLLLVTKRFLNLFIGQYKFHIVVNCDVNSVVLLRFILASNDNSPMLFEFPYLLGVSSFTAGYTPIWVQIRKSQCTVQQS